MRRRRSPSRRPRCAPTRPANTWRWAGRSAGAERWFAELIARYPADLRASVARFRLAASAYREGRFDSAAVLYQGEVAAGGTGGPQRTGARFWLGKIALARGDTAGARATWR